MRIRFIVFLLLVFVSLPAVYKLLRPGYYSMYDDMQVVRLQQMDECINDGQIPCRWVPDLGLGYGYPLFIYYAPLPYYFMEGIHLIGFSFINSVKIGFAASVVLSALFFYLLLKYFFSKKAALFATFFYVFAPLRAAGIYVRGAMGEVWGLASVPLLFWSLEYLLSKKTIRSGVLLSFSLAAFLVTHNLTVLMFLPLFLLWVVLRLYQTKPNKKFVLHSLFFISLGIGLSSFFVIPLIREHNLVHLETLTSGYFGYLQHFLNLKQLFLSLKWGYGPSILGTGDNALLGIGPIHSFLAISGFLLVFYKHRNAKKLMIPILLILIFFVSAFLTHERSTFIWKILKLDIMQFPWRFVGVSVFVSSFLAGFLLENLSKKIVNYISIFMVVLTLALYLPFFQPRDWFNITDSEKLSGENLKKQLTASIYDYLPKSAKRAPDDFPVSNLIPIDGQIVINVEKSGSNWFYYDLDVISNNASVAIPTYDFPSWSIAVNNKKVDYVRYGDFGQPGFILQGGRNQIYAKLVKTWDRKLGDGLTIFSLGAIATLFLYEKSIKKYI